MQAEALVLQSAYGFGWGGVVSGCGLKHYWSTIQHTRALNNEIIKQVTSSWSLFIQLSR